MPDVASSENGSNVSVDTACDSNSVVTNDVFTTFDASNHPSFSHLPSGPLHRQSYNAKVYKNCQYTIIPYYETGTIMTEDPEDPTSEIAAEEIPDAEGGIDVIWNPKHKEKRVFGGWSDKTTDPKDKTTVTRIESRVSPHPSVPGYGASFYTNIDGRSHLAVACDIRQGSEAGAHSVASRLLISEPLQPFPVDGVAGTLIANGRTSACACGTVTEYGDGRDTREYTQDGTVHVHKGGSNGQASQGHDHAGVAVGL
jgi:hypothetical protein